MQDEKPKDHLEETKYLGPSNNTVVSVHLLNKYQKRALDLGCGSFRSSKFLFSCGFIVDAIDKDEAVKDYTPFFRYRPKELFNLIVADYLQYDLGEGKYDIIIAENTLSFNLREEVLKVIAKIKIALKSGGMFAGNFYGLKDFRAVGRPKMSFYIKEEAESILKQIGQIHKLIETEGKTEKGNKPLHTYEFVVEKE